MIKENAALFLTRATSGSRYIAAIGGTSSTLNYIAVSYCIYIGLSIVSFSTRRDPTQKSV